MNQKLIAVARLALAGAMLHCASKVWTALSSDFTGFAADGAAGATLAALATFTAAWLVLGVRTRAVALMSVVVHAGAVQWLGTHHVMAGHADVAVPLLATAVMLGGGGAWAMSHSGWRGLM